jgi:hypothetical protein
MVRARICLVPQTSNLIALETFIGGCSFLSENQRLRCLLVATEYFDNIVRYGRSRFSNPVVVEVHSCSGSVRDNRPVLRLRYATSDFSGMVGAVGTTKPYFDPGSGRYRGLGLRMCANLSSGIRYKKGLLRSSVIIIL